MARGVDRTFVERSKYVRTNTWLLSRLNELWDRHFADVPQQNRVFITFGRRARLRFGSIKMEEFSMSSRAPACQRLSAAMAGRMSRDPVGALTHGRDPSLALRMTKEMLRMTDIPFFRSLRTSHNQRFWASQKNGVSFGKDKRGWDDNISIITITSLFKNPRIPQAIVDYTIAHELVHYSHGFSSPLPQKHRHPHYGGIVHREMKARGMGELVQRYTKWIKMYRRRMRREG